MSDNKKESNNKIWKQVVVIGAIVMIFLVYGISQFALTPNNKEYIGGNVINMVYRGEWSEENKINSPWVNAAMYTGLMYRNLFLSDYTFTELENDLVDSYEISPDGLTYSFTLKDDVLWSDGEALTAEDVAFSIDRSLLTTATNAIYMSAFGNIKGAQAHIENPDVALEGVKVEGNTVIITLDQPYPTLLQVLGQFAIFPEHALGDVAIADFYFDAYWDNPVVSGMYKVSEIVPFDYIQFVKNEHYGEKEPKIDEIHLDISGKNEEFDCVSTTNIAEMINYQAMVGMMEYPIEVLFYRYFIFNMEGEDGNQNEAMQDVRVRQAIAHAIDREGILKDVYSNAGSLVHSGVPSYYDVYNGDEIEYNPEKAKELLAEANYDFNREIRIAYYYGDDTTKYFLDRIMDNLEAVGFKVVTTAPDEGMSGSTKLMEVRDYDIGLKGLSAFQVAEWYNEYLTTNINFKMIFPKDAELNDLVVEYNTTTDDGKRDKLLDQLQDMEAEVMYKLPLFTLGGASYINTDRIKLPGDVVFANPYYKYDMNFENWEIKQQ